MERSDRIRSPSPLSSRSASNASDTFALLNEKREKLIAKRMPRLRAAWYIIGLICLGSVFAELVWYFASRPSEAPAPDVTLADDLGDYMNEFGAARTFTKPSDLRVVALVFYSSRAKTSILDCYLQQNLVSNGGLLDTVTFVPETGQEEDLDWLELLAHSHPSYRIDGGNMHHGARERRHSGVNVAWQIVRPGTMYIHISSEIVYLEPTTIPSLVQSRLRHPEYSIISANIINQPTMSWIHHHLGVVRPYRPEMKPLLRPLNTSDLPRWDWRASQLPTWDGPNDFNVPADFGVPTDFEPPFSGHRWLPLRTNETSINPLTHETLDVNGPGSWAWTTGALHHYSFLEHLEENDLYRYKFPLWDLQHELLTASMMVMWGQDIIEVRPMPAKDSDKWLSREVPRKLRGRSPVIDGRALAVHFAHQQQKPGLPSTDLLGRYSAYAQENVCR